MARALHKKQNSGGYIDRAISAQKREARRPSRRIVPDELDNVFDDVDVDDNSDGNADGAGGELKDVDGTISENGNNSDDDAGDEDDE